MITLLIRKKTTPFLLVISILLTSIACNSSKNTPFDKKEWLQALKNPVANSNGPIHEKITEFKEVYKSPMLVNLDEKHIYIRDSHTKSVIIYSKLDGRIVKTFGGKGEGPFEFRQRQSCRIEENHIFVNSMGKNSYFTKKGEPIRETKCPANLIPLIPVGDNFVTRDYTMTTEKDSATSIRYDKIVVVNSDFEEERVIFEKKILKGIVLNAETGRSEVRLFSPGCYFRVYNNHIYLGFSAREQFEFSVFDSAGRKQYDIIRPYQKKEVPEVIKEAIRNSKKSTDWNNKRMTINFDKYYVSFGSFEVADDRIYVFLLPEKERQKVLIMDLKGRIIKVKVIPFDIKYVERFSYFWLLYRRLFIKDGYFYYLKNNEDTDILELWREKLI